MTRPAALAAVRAVSKKGKKEKNTIPQCRKHNSGKFRKAKKEKQRNTLAVCCSKVSSRIRPRAHGEGSISRLSLWE